MGRLLVIVPTYDERENVRPIADAVLGHVPEAHILFVDDNSPDGTGEIIDAICAENDHVHVLHQEHKGGLGAAYINGFKWGLAESFDFLMEMDADFSHDPAEVPVFLSKMDEADLVLGSRYMHGIRITNWPLSRLILSKTAATYVRIITGMPITDPTGGYKCFRREVLEAINLDRIMSNGYAFQIEMSHKAWMKGFRITEIPITFEDRRAGYSKMSGAIVKEASWVVWTLAIQNRFRRTPDSRPPASS